MPPPPPHDPPPDLPPVTILLASYQGAAHLAAQLDSIAAQDHTGWALWVSDDGSTDGTREIVETFRRETPGHEIRLVEGPGRGAAAYSASKAASDHLARAWLDSEGVAMSQGDAVLSGNHVAAFAETYAQLEAEGAARIVADGDDLAARVAALLTKPDELATMTAAAARFIAAQDDQLDAIASRLITTLKLDTP